MPLFNFNTTLTWSQFSQVPATGSLDENAQINVDMATSNMSVARERRAVKVGSLDITIRLIASNCWVVSNQMSAPLLKHEQGHYDILALVARKLYNDLMAVRAPDVTTLQQSISSLFNAAMARAQVIDTRYDEQTQHGTNTDVQQRWDQNLATAKQSATGTVSDLP